VQAPQIQVQTHKCKSREPKIQVQTQRTSPDTQNTIPDAQNTSPDTQLTSPDTPNTRPGTKVHVQTFQVHVQTTKIQVQTPQIHIFELIRRPLGRSVMNLLQPSYRLKQTSGSPYHLQLAEASGLWLSKHWQLKRPLEENLMLPKTSFYFRPLAPFKLCTLGCTQVLDNTHVYSHVLPRSQGPV